MNLSLKFRDQMVGDLGIVGEEFDQLFAAINARLPVGVDGSLIIGGLGKNANTKFQQIEVTDAAHLKTLVKLDGQIEFLKGPWVFDPPNAGHIAILRPPDPTGTYNDYTTQGLNDAIGVELEPSGATTITGISNPMRRKRLLFLRNRDSSNSITLKDADAGSAAGNRFDFAGASMGGGTGVHALLGPGHTDTTTQTVSRGSLIYGNSTPAWDELVIGAANRVLRSDGTDASWAQVVLTTDVTGVLPVANGGTGSASGGPLFTVNFTLTEAQLEAMNATPITVISAAGSGTIIVPVYLAIKTAITDNYTTSPAYRLRWSGASVDLIDGINPTWTSTGTKWNTEDRAAASIGIDFAATDPRNTAVEISLASDLTDSEGVATATGTIWYLVHTVV